MKTGRKTSDRSRLRSLLLARRNVRARLMKNRRFPRIRSVCTTAQDRTRELKAPRPSTPREVRSHGTAVLDTWSLRGYAVPPGDATEVDVSPIVGRVCAVLVMEADAIWEYREHSVSRTRQRTTNRAFRNDDDDDDKPDAPIPAGRFSATACKTPLKRFKVQRSSLARFFRRRTRDRPATIDESHSHDRLARPIDVGGYNTTQMRPMWIPPPSGFFPRAEVTFGRR